MKNLGIKKLTSGSQSDIVNTKRARGSISFEWYRSSAGCPFRKYIESLPKEDKAKILARIVDVEKHGIKISIDAEWVKKIEDNLYEIRVTDGKQLRGLYFHYVSDRYVITNGFTKKQGPVPENEKRIARQLRKEYFGRICENEEE